MFYRCQFAQDNGLYVYLANSWDAVFVQTEIKGIEPSPDDIADWIRNGRPPLFDCVFQRVMREVLVGKL